MIPLRTQKIPIFIEKRNPYFKSLPRTKKIFKNITDSPDSDSKITADDDADDAPNTADDYAGSTESKISPYYFRDCNHALDDDDDDADPPWWCFLPQLSHKFQT